MIKTLLTFSTLALVTGCQGADQQSELKLKEMTKNYGKTLLIDIHDTGNEMHALDPETCFDQIGSVRTYRSLCSTVSRAGRSHVD